MKIRTSFLSTFTFLILLSVIVVCNPLQSKVLAACSPDCSDYDECVKRKEECVKVLNSIGKKKSTLKIEIERLDSQIYLTELKIKSALINIQKTEEKITKLARDIESLGIRIDKLQGSIDYQAKVLGLRMRERYKDKDESVFMLVFGSDTLNQIISKSEYLKVMELNDDKLIKQMKETKKSFEEQKKLFTEKKNEAEDLKKQLQVEKANLDSYRVTLEDQKVIKQNLLAQTQNDEVKYQKMLAEAEKQLISFVEFTQYAGGGIIGSNEFGSGKEGWYLSQRDSRWANKRIGESDNTIFEVGCLVTSVAMVYNHYGYSVTPADIAKNNSRFFLDTALMLVPWVAPPGKIYASVSAASVDTELKKRPVIVGVYAGAYGTHFVVLSSKSGDDYTMYDPWYGPDLKFSKYYTKGSIFSASVFK